MFNIRIYVLICIKTSPWSCSNLNFVPKFSFHLNFALETIHYFWRSQGIARAEQSCVQTCSLKRWWCGLNCAVLQTSVYRPMALLCFLYAFFKYFPWCLQILCLCYINDIWNSMKHVFNVWKCKFDKPAAVNP